MINRRQHEFESVYVGAVRIKVIRNGSPPLAIALPALLSLHSDILAILISIYSADQILDPRQHSSNQVKPSIHIQTQQVMSPGLTL